MQQKKSCLLPPLFLSPREPLFLLIVSSIRLCGKSFPLYRGKTRNCRRLDYSRLFSGGKGVIHSGVRAHKRLPPIIPQNGRAERWGKGYHTRAHERRAIAPTISPPKAELFRAKLQTVCGRVFLAACAALVSRYTGESRVINAWFAA